MRESWIVGALVLALLVGLHWLAYRVGQLRQRRKRLAEAGRPSATGSMGSSISNDPLSPR